MRKRRGMKKRKENQREEEMGRKQCMNEQEKRKG
jgi:hypothetical protein